MIVFYVFIGAIAILSLGLSVNVGVAAERLKLAGRQRDQWIAVVVSACLGLGALYCAFLIGQSAQPH